MGSGNGSSSPKRQSRRGAPPQFPRPFSQGCALASAVTTLVTSQPCCRSVRLFTPAVTSDRPMMRAKRLFGRAMVSNFWCEQGCGKNEGGGLEEGRPQPSTCYRRLCSFLASFVTIFNPTCSTRVQQGALQPKQLGLLPQAVPAALPGQQYNPGMMLAALHFLNRTA